jgi:hypothetical protein
MNLWNFKTGNRDTNVTVTDSNVTNYYPENKILDNLYASLRDQGEQPLQAYQSILERITWPQIG